MAYILISQAHGYYAWNYFFRFEISDEVHEFFETGMTRETDSEELSPNALDDLAVIPELSDPLLVKVHGGGPDLTHLKGTRLTRNFAEKIIL